MSAEPSKTEFVVSVLKAHKELIEDTWIMWNAEQSSNKASKFKDYLIDRIDQLIKDGESETV